MMPTANIQNTFKLLFFFCILVAAFIILNEFKAKKTIRMTDGDGNVYTGEIKTHYFGGKKVSLNPLKKSTAKTETTEKAA